VDYFLGYLSQYYELVLFTTMPMAYADQIIKKLDPYHFMTWPLFREATRYENGQYIKASRTSQQLTYLLT
jgi:import inner membrane translocase subunit TIM50